MELQPNAKIVLLDWSVFFFKAVHAHRAMLKNGSFAMKPMYLIGMMIIGCLNKIGLQNDDMIIIALDSRKSWRKQFSDEYKANRKELREKQESEEWWNQRFAESDELKKQLDISTSWIFLEIKSFEADDLMAIAAKMYPNNKVVIVSHDSDLEMLTYYPNVSIFSPTSKKYKVVKNPLGLIDKKIKCERTDNLISEVKTEEDYLRRKMLVDLIHLPEKIETLGKALYETVEPKIDFDYSKFPFPKLLPRLIKAYNSTDIVAEPSKDVKPRAKRKRKEKQLTIG